MEEYNPFTLTFGRLPDNFIDRYENSNTVIDTFKHTSLSQTYLIEGVRGSGKTVLMTYIAKQLDQSDEWVVVNLNPALDLLGELATRLNDACETIPNFFSQGFNLSFAGFGVGVNGNENLRDHTSIIKSILSALKTKKKKVLITIDEVLHDQNMRVFASQFQIFLREDYPVYLIMTGLNKNIHDIQHDPSLTFLLRSPKINMKPLSLIQIANSYKRIFQIDEEKASEMAGLTKGYAFMYQALGAVYWEFRERPDMDMILEKVDTMLDDYVYQKIWESCTKRDREFLLAIKHDNTTAEEICKATKMKVNSYSQYRDKLLRQEILTAPAHGCLSLALPRFYEVIRRYAV